MDSSLKVNRGNFTIVGRYTQLTVLCLLLVSLVIPHAVSCTGHVFFSQIFLSVVTSLSNFIFLRNILKFSVSLLIIRSLLLLQRSFLDLVNGIDLFFAVIKKIVVH